MPIYKIITLSVIFAVLLSACSSGPVAIPKEPDASFVKTTNVASMNKEMRLKVLAHERDESVLSVNLEVMNIGENSIFLPMTSQKQYLKVYIFQANQWVEIKNNQKYISGSGGDGSILQPYKDDPGNILTTWARPALADVALSTNKIVRIFVVGQLLQDGVVTENYVGAYVDLVLEP
jgi:hypothetical protein